MKNFLLLIILKYRSQEPGRPNTVCINTKFEALDKKNAEEIGAKTIKDLLAVFGNENLLITDYHLYENCEEIIS